MIQFFRKYVIFLLIFLNPYLYSQELYLREDISNKGVQKFIKDYNLKIFKIFNEPKFLDGENLDEKLLVSSLLKEFPNKNDSNFLVLNWEKKGIDVLTNQKNEKEFNFFLKEYVRALNIIKKYRPNLKVSFYGIPFPKWNKNDLNYYKKVSNLSILLKEQDFLSPSLYVLNSKNLIETKSYIKNSISFALSIGKEYNKPIYPFVWHRAHTLDKGNEWQLLSKDMFSTVINIIKNENYKGLKVSGIFWWHSENNGFLKLATIKEYENISDIDIYRYKIFKNYYKKIRNN